MVYSVAILIRGGVKHLQIKEVCHLTGLSAKAVRLNESKGLISVDRAANAYREYTDEQIERLCAIRRFRLSAQVPGRGGD